MTDPRPADPRRPLRTGRPSASGGLRGFAATVALLALAGCGASVLPQIHSPGEKVPVAQRLYEKGDVANAILLLKDYIGTGSGNADIDRAVYLLGLCYLKNKEFASGQAEFERLLRDYPESDSSGSAAFRIGEALFGQSREPDFDQEFTLKALTAWQEYLKSWPDHWLVSEAERRVLECRTRLATKLLNTANLYVKLGHIGPARTYFESVTREYSDTAPYGDALLGLAVCEARLGHREEALLSLRRLEEDFKDRPLGARAAETRRQIESGKLRPLSRSPKHKAVDAESPARAAAAGP